VPVERCWLSGAESGLNSVVEELDCARSSCAAAFFPIDEAATNPESAFKLAKLDEAGALPPAACAECEWYGLLAKAALASSEPDWMPSAEATRANGQAMMECC
jgi:hypothetical protein